MIKKMLIAVVIFALVLIVGGILALVIGGENKSAEVKIGSAVFKVEIASSIMQHSRGLSGRQQLSDNEGMLFVFSSPGFYSFWMKGMIFPLDIIWISEDRIVGIESNIPPPAGIADNLKTYTPRFAIDKVLEINAGLAEKYKFKIGQQMEIIRN